MTSHRETSGSWPPRLRALALALLLAGATAAPAQPDAREADDDDDDAGAASASGQVFALPNLGGHTGMIHDLAFSKDGRKLYSVGNPGDICEWDVSNGRQLRVWRVQGYATRLAIAADGSRLAVSVYGSGDRRQIWTIDLPEGHVKAGPVVGPHGVHGIALSPDGKRLAVNADNKTVVYGLDKGKVLGTYGEKCKAPALLFSPAPKTKSDRLLIVAHRKKNEHEPAQLYYVNTKGETPGVPLAGAQVFAPRAAWSADGEHIAVMHGLGRDSLRVWSVTGKKLVHEDDGKKMKDLIGDPNKQAAAVGVGFVSKQEVIACWAVDGWLRAVRVNLAKGGATTLLPMKHRHQNVTSGRVAFSPDGRWMAVTTDPAFRVALYDLKAGSLTAAVRNIGPDLEPPRSVAWAKTGHGIAWGYKENQPPTRGLDVGAMEPLSAAAVKGATSAGRPAGWRVSGDELIRGARRVKIKLSHVSESPALMARVGGKDVLLVLNDNRKHISAVDPDSGEPLRQIGPRFSPVYDMALSPDQKFLLVAGGGPQVSVFSLERTEKQQARHPLLRVMSRGDDWVAWPNASGYYAGTPNGERMLGFKVVSADDKPAEFFTAQRFGKRLYQPEVLKRVLSAGGATAALREYRRTLVAKGQARGVDEKPTEVDDLVPPAVELKVVSDSPAKGKVTVTARAKGGAKGQPVQVLRLLIDGRQAGEKKPDKDGKADWTVDAPPGVGEHEVLVLARCPDVSGASEAYALEVKAPPKDRPALHVLAVGVDKMGDASLDLKCAVADAKAIHAGMATACVGEKNLFGSARTAALLTDAKATAAGVLKELTEMRDKARRGDLVVVFYAGHGTEQDGEFYLLTHGSDPKNLARTALKGRDLRETLKGFESHVLLLLDACHSGKVGQVLRSATDAAARGASDEECGAFVLAAAMGHQKAFEPKGGGNGLFTQGLLEALGNKGLFDPRDNRQYVHHLHTTVADLVRDKSGGRQLPFFCPPWTAEPFAVRKAK